MLIKLNLLCLIVGRRGYCRNYRQNFIDNGDYKYSNKAVFGLFVTFYWSGAMVGRFIGSYLTKIFQAGRVLSFFALIAIFLIFLSAISNGLISMWSILAIGLFNSIMFPTIFTLSPGIQVLTISAPINSTSNEDGSRPAPKSALGS